MSKQKLRGKQLTSDQQVANYQLLVSCIRKKVIYHLGRNDEAYTLADQGIDEGYLEFMSIVYPEEVVK